jgi:hypothetical protein
MNEKETFERLHTAMANMLLARIESGEATAADLSVARQFLKDNGIDMMAKQGTPMLKLAEVLPFDAAGDDIAKFA